MGRPKETGISPVVRVFEQYSTVLTMQLDLLWKRSIELKTRNQIPEGDDTSLTISTLRRCVLSLRDAMPYIMSSLAKPLLSEFTKIGLNALIHEANRTAFEWILNREVALKVSKGAAVTADVSLANILAMHTGNSKYKPRQHDLHIRIKPYSPTLAMQIADLYERSQVKDPKLYALTWQRLRRSILSLVKALPLILPKLPQDIYKQFFEQGLNCLADEKACAVIEFWGVHQSVDNHKLETRFDDALTNLRSMYFDRKYLPFSHVQLTRQNIDISRAMSLDFSEFCELKALVIDVGLNYESKNEKNDNTINDGLNVSVNHIQRLLKNELRNLDSDRPLKERLSKHSEIVQQYISDCKYRPHSFSVFLKNAIPEEYGEQKVVPLRSESDFLTYIESISSQFSREYTRFLSTNEANDPRKTSFQKSFAKYLYIHQESDLIITAIGILKKHGILGFANNNGQGFSLLSEYAELIADDEQEANTIPLNAALAMYNLIAESDKRLSHFLPHTLVFKNENDGSVFSFNFEFLAKNYPPVFKDFQQYAEEEIKERIQVVTVAGNLSRALAVFKKYHHTLSSSDIEQLNQQGLKALGNHKNKLLNHFRQQIQADNKSSKIKSPYALALQTALNQVASFAGVPKSDAYLVSVAKQEKLARRNNKKKLYSFQQVVEIAYSIEKLLRRTNLTEVQTLCLHAARIFVKTGWNLTPTLELNVDDLVYFDVPFQGNKTAAVRLFKRRANYQTDWPEFSPGQRCRIVDASVAFEEYETGKVTAAVMSNLEDIRDMTNGISSQHSLQNLKRRIFAYKDRSGVRILTASSFTSCINRLLKSCGITHSFNVTKIRKKGMNYTYRKVAKNFDKYQKAGMHTPQAFYQYYLMMDGTEVEETLSTATQTMGDFLIRGDTENVIFVDKAPEKSRKTPSGRCVQTADSDVVVDFKKQNRNFFDDDEINVCADFGACLFCGYFRCIADAESVWRILSYERVVIERMQSAAYSIGGDDGSNQQQRINKIKKRVKLILSSLSEIDPLAVPEGEKLFNEHGIHPDWEVV